MSHIMYILSTHFLCDVNYMSAKMGRRPLEPGKARSKGLHIRLTEQERVLIDAKALMEGSKTASEWARKILLASLQK